MWWDSETGIRYVYYNDGNSSQWVQESYPAGGITNPYNQPFSFANTNASTSTSTGAITVSGGAGIAGNVYVGSAINVTYTPPTAIGAAITATGKDTIGGVGYFDFFKITNTTSGATNPNKTLRLSSTGGLEIVDSTYNNTLFTLTNVGNLSIKGTIGAGAWTAGQVIKDTILSNSEVTVVGTTIAASGTTTNFITYNYTPVSASSYLIVHIHISKYQSAGGTGDDAWYSQLLVDGTEIAYGWQMVNDDGNGTSGRSGVLFPLTGRYTNASTSAKQIQIAARRDTADDSLTIDNSATAIWMRITEVAR
jgi:hypothetical protein